jgi:nitrate/nitrite transporter NarK
MSFEEEESPEPRSVLGLPVRLLLGLGSSAVPLLAVAMFSASHDWPPPPSCEFAIFGCPSAPYPLAVLPVDWLYLAGPVLGLVSAVGALGLRKVPREAGILVLRYALPVVGLFVCVGCALQLLSWVTQAAK